MSKQDDTKLAGAARAAPYLTREEELSLAQAWSGRRDEKALHRMVSAHMRLVIALASRFRHYGLPMSDLVQEGNVGLMEAAARFEPARDVRFSTYAAWWIRAALQDYVLRNWSIVRGGTSSRQKALFFKLRRVRSRLKAMHHDMGETMISNEIALALGVSPRDVETMSARLSGNDVSLNVPVGDAGSDTSLERQDMIASDDPLPDRLVEQAIDGERRVGWLQDAMRQLNPRELSIVTARRLDEPAITLESLGEKLGISKERVRQIENRAVEKLKAAVLERAAEREDALV